MRTSLRGIANRAKKDSKAKFGNLYGLLNVDNLRECFYKLKRGAAPGVDGTTFHEYEGNLETNLDNLVDRLKGKRYRAKLVRRKLIPKPGGKLRPLGIPALEDKLLQVAASSILAAIYEQDFLDNSQGYRPGRGPRQASRTLAGRLAIGKYHWIVEADIRGFFDRIDHDWLLRMIGERVNDAAFSGLIAKWLKAGILEEDGKTIHPVTGTPQGGIVSPILANIYLHHAFDLWFERKIRPRQRGQAMFMRYADDFVCAFENRGEAEAFMNMLSERLGKFGLELAEEKSALVRFSRHAMKENGAFSFLGFLYHWTLSRNGKPKVQRMTDPKKLRASVAAFAGWIRSKRHQRAHRIMAQLKRKLAGYWNYYGITGNSRSLGKYWWSVLGLLHKWLNRRSHRRSYTWKGLMACLADFRIPPPRITEQANANDSDRQLWFIFAN
jgi:group II intron reverse transcriptase/maturase